MNYSNKLVTICLIVLAAFPTGAVAVATQDSQVKVEATVSLDSVQVAQPFQLQLKCTAPTGARLSFPPETAQIGEFDVVNVRDDFDVPSTESDGLRTWTRKMILECIVTGEQAIPSMEIQVALDSLDSNWKQFKTDPININVLSVLEDRPDPTNFRDLKPLVDLEVAGEKSSAWIWWSAGGAGVLSLLAAGAFFVTRARKRLTPLEWAMGELQKIESDSRLQNHDEQELVTDRVASVVRDYLEMKLDVSAPTQTTAELMQAIRGNGLLGTETQMQLGRLFALSDQAKYAGLDLTEKQINVAIQEARELVEQIAIDQRSQILTDEYFTDSHVSDV